MSTTARTFKVTRADHSQLLTWEEAEAELRRVIDSLALPSKPERRPGRRGGSFNATFSSADHLFRYVRGVVIQGSRYKIAGVTFEEVKSAPAPAFHELTVEPDDEGGEWNAWEV